MNARAEDVREQLANERAGRTIAVAGAAAAIVLQVVGEILKRRASGQLPDPGPGRALELPGFLAAHAGELIAAEVLGLVGLAAMIAPLDHLYRATKFRRPELPRLLRLLLWAGPLLLGLGGVAFHVVISGQAADYVAAGEADYAAARQIGRGTAGFVAGQAQQLGIVSLVLVFVMVSLNAMRAGLLTRFMGVLGIMIGVLLVASTLVPLFGESPVLRVFWLGALAALIAGRWPGGVPPAWRSGEAEPWPSGREARGQEQARHLREEAARQSEGEDASVATPTSPSRSRKRRGRKRR